MDFIVGVAQQTGWYVVSSDDRMISPEQQKGMAKQINATTTVRSGSHAVMQSRQKKVAKVIEEAAAVRNCV